MKDKLIVAIFWWVWPRWRHLGSIDQLRSLRDGLKLDINRQEQHERDVNCVAVYSTYPLSRKGTYVAQGCYVCSYITGYFCQLCNKPVCGTHHQEHTDWHWSLRLQK